MYRNESLMDLAHFTGINLKLFDKKYPMQIEALINKIGFSISQRNITQSSHIQLSTKTIIVKSSEHPFRKRYIVAHELGHYVKNHIIDEDCKSENIQQKIDVNTEQEANEFAVELLMPKYKVSKMFDKYSENNVIERLSLFFAVSESAIRHRLVNLGLNDVI